MEKFKLKLDRSTFSSISDTSKAVESKELEVLSEPIMILVDVFLLTSGDFSGTYSTMKGAKIARKLRKFIDFEIEKIKENAWEYTVKVKN